MSGNDYYVYVYIDPRNFEEFYYGKGTGSRKYAHLKDDSDTDKARRIKAIQEEGLEPVIRVIARNLSEHDALLVEKTLLWKLGKQLTNIASGHYSDNFRPHYVMHKSLAGFDFQNGLYYYNVGEGAHRNWDDYVRFGFISAGQASRFRDAMQKFQVGDVIAAYLKGFGFVGIGRITAAAKPVRDVFVGQSPLLKQPLICSGLSQNSDHAEKSEYVALVDWIKTVPQRKEAKWEPKSGLFTSQLIRASLENQPETVQFLEKSFSISIDDLLI